MREGDGDVGCPPVPVDLLVEDPTSHLPLEAVSEVVDLRVCHLCPGLVKEHAPDAIVMLGEAGPEEVIRLELVALNHDDFRMPDNDGVVAEPSRIVDAGPDAYFSNLNVHSIETVVPVDDSHANVTISLTAGSFLCNHTYFLARHFHADIPALFIHIPCLREETHTPDAFDRVTRSVNCIVQEITATLAASTPD